MPYLEKGVVAARRQLASQLDMAIQPAGSRKGDIRNKMGGMAISFSLLPYAVATHATYFKNPWNNQYKQGRL